MTDASPEDVAQWLLSEVTRQYLLYQEFAVDEIAERFGAEFVYYNDSGNPAIDRRVLRAFRKVSGDTVVWDRWDRAWRKRSSGDAPGRQQE
jgi:hypothetical protein